MNYKLKHFANRNLIKLPFMAYFGKVFAKYFLESYFWEQELNNYIAWYQGDIKELYGCATPKEEQKVKSYTLKDSALLTWLTLFQKIKYASDLEIAPNSFKGLKVLDIGSGPFPSAVVFGAEELYCLDPLIHKYVQFGYPIHLYDSVKFVNSYSENIPFPDNYFDVVLAVNSIDHVDSFEKTAKEITRVLKKDGKLALHAHCHPKTFTEPLFLDTHTILKNFGNIPNFKLIKETKNKYGWEIKENDETYYLFKNF